MRGSAELLFLELIRKYESRAWEAHEDLVNARAVLESDDSLDLDEQETFSKVASESYEREEVFWEVKKDLETLLQRLKAMGI